MSTFSKVPPSAVDPMLVLMMAQSADTHPHKVDLIPGTFKTEQGAYYEFSAVAKAKAVVAKENLGHDYIPIYGLPGFKEAAAELIFGSECKRLASGQIKSLQTIAGTGANRLAGAFLKHHFPQTFPYDQPSENRVKAYVGLPAWSNHVPLLRHAGFDVVTYKYFDSLAGGLQFETFMTTLRNAPNHSVFVLQGSCHNPTGADLTHDQWKTVAAEMKARGHFPLFDIAYLGFGDGLEEDVWSIRYFVESDFDMIVCQSFSKNMGLYGERLGCLHAVCQSAEIAANVQDQIRSLIRWEYSSPSAFSARVATKIMTDQALRQEWNDELRRCSQRIKYCREKLHQLLTDVYHTPGDWGCILEQKGFFSYLPISPEQTKIMAAEYHVYIVDQGRVNMAAVNGGNVDAVAFAIDAAIRAT